MTTRFTIGRKIGIGFGVVILMILIVFYKFYHVVSEGTHTFAKATEINQTIENITEPSKNYLTKLKEHLIDADRQIQLWVAGGESREDAEFKLRYEKLVWKIIPNDRIRIESIVSYLSDHDRKSLNIVFTGIDELLELHENQVIRVLPDFASYQDPTNIFTARIAVNEDSPIAKKTKEIIFELDDLIQRKSVDGSRQKNKMNASFTDTSQNFNELIKQVFILFIVLVIGAGIFATLTAKSITSPVHKLQSILIDLGRGIFPEKQIKHSNDEIGDMTIALNTLVDGLQRTTDFSREVGSGNFDYDYKPLSQDDTLGFALLKMRDDLAENERILEQKVIERTEEVVRQKEELEKQRQELEELYNDVTDSIRYAKRLQESILPPEDHIRKLIPDNFVLFLPKDIVSGDFYWFEETNKKTLFAAVDCTGHGVPGAFMSLVGANALKQCVGRDQLNSPALILDNLNKLSLEALNKSKDDLVGDGMDIAICAISEDRKTLEYAGANNPLYHIRDGELTKIKADKFAIGAFNHEEHNYTSHTMDLKPGDQLYIFSDGYADQFGGEKDKKFMYKRFRETLLANCHLSLDEQREQLYSVIQSWKGPNEQVDDILVIGVKV